MYFNFRKDWILTTICIIIIFVSLPLMWLKKFLSKKIEKRIPRSNIVPMSIQSTSNQTFGTKSSHSTSPITAIEPKQTIEEFFKDSRILNEGTTPPLNLSFNNRKHNKNLISLTGILILFVLIFTAFSLALASRLGWTSILNITIYMYFSMCFVPIILPTMYFTQKPQHLIVVLKDFNVIWINHIKTYLQIFFVIHLPMKFWFLTYKIRKMFV